MRPALALAALLGLSLPAAAADCPPDALGPSRVQKLGTQGGVEVGLKTYPATVPLADHEVILTFDDGPDPKTTPAILDALKAQCVEATFFAIGKQADAYPDVLKREAAEGHNVAYHTYTHPQPTMRDLPAAFSRADILKGVIAVERAAYGLEGTPDELSKIKMHAPFFRYTGFADTADLNGWFAANGIAVFSVDLWASDWIPMTADQELKLILARLEARKKGMLLFHDNKPWTAEMMPKFLAALKARGYKVVHVEAGPGSGPVEAAPPGWRNETARSVEAIKWKAGKPPAKAEFELKPAPLE
jgi:peptidoglycan/xylan/chitin deacetylase (PgdA/CDA1 family)